MNAFKISYASGNSYVTSMNATLAEARAYFITGQAVVVAEDDLTGKETFDMVKNVEQI